MTDSAALERLEAKMDVAILVAGGMSLEQAELQVYLAKLNETVQEMRAILKEYRR